MSAVAMAVDAMPADGAVSVESTVSLGYASYNQSTADYKSCGDENTQCQNYYLSNDKRNTSIRNIRNASIWKKNPDINIYLSKLMVCSKGLTIKLDYVYSVALYILIRNTGGWRYLFGYLNFMDHLFINMYFYQSEHKREILSVFYYIIYK